MSITVFLAVLGAAFLHAAWNAVVKGGTDKRLGIGAVVLGHIPIALVCLTFVPLPAAECLPYLTAGVAIHFAYQLMLMQSYRIGDLTQVYPIARGSAPLLVALVSVGFLGVSLSRLELLGVLIIGLGILSLALVRRADGLRNGPAAAMALATGVTIAAYSLVDGIGARLSGNSLAFYAWLSLINGFLMIVYLRFTAPGVIGQVLTKGRLLFVIGGGASFVAYAIATWAFTQAPIALVTALRETSIVFALLIGVFFLKERLDLVKVASTMTTLLGVAILRLGKS